MGSSCSIRPSILVFAFPIWHVSDGKCYQEGIRNDDHRFDSTEGSSILVVVEEPKAKQSVWDVIAPNEDSMSDDGSSHGTSVLEEMMIFFTAQGP